MATLGDMFAHLCAVTGGIPAPVVRALTVSGPGRDGALTDVRVRLLRHVPPGHRTEPALLLRLATLDTSATLRDAVRARVPGIVDERDRVAVLLAIGDDDV